MKLKLLFLTFLFSVLSWGQATLPVSTTNLSRTSLPTGFSHTGLGTDYAGPILKFDTTADNLVLFFDTTPGTLTFDVGVNNNFSTTIPATATFTLLESIDGITYTSVSVYSNIATGTKTITTLNSTSRYLKWEYTLKPSGSNIALYNINLTASVSATYSVTYDGNTNTGGTTPTDATVYSSGDPVIVLGNTGSLVKTGFAFNGWNTASDGSGTTYVGGNTFNITANTTLYAQWLNTSPPVITSSLTASGNQGSAFTYTITATNTPTSYNATGLPAGLTIDTVTGIISGTPTTTGTTNVTISATNAYGTDTQTLVITITTGPCLSESSFTSLPVGWIDNTITYSGGEAVFGGNNGDLTTLAVSNPASLTFDLRRTTNATAKDFIIEVSTTTQGGIYTTVTTYNLGNTTSGGTTACTVDLSAYTSFPTVYIRFRKVSLTTSPWYLQNVNVFCGTPPDVEIDIQGNALSILDGDTTPSTTDDTDFGTTLVGNSVSHTFTITNTGTDPLDISSITITGVDAADFYISINPGASVAAGGSTTFEITFSPSALGISNATINIVNNDSNENPYTFDITGEAIACTPTTSVSSITPTSGPVGTMVTINGSGFATATTVNFGGSSATFTVVSGTVIEAIVPVGATTGNITIQDAGGCDLPYSSFTVITEDNSSCEGIAVTTDLIIYDIHDEKTGSGGFITIYNGTAATVDLTNYSIWRTSNYGDGNEIDYATTTGTIAAGALGILKVSTGSCGPASTNGTITNGFNEDDGIQLRDVTGTVIIDDVHTYATAPGYYMVRNTGALSARTTYVAADWSITPLAAGECYPSAGLVLPSGNGNSPLVTLNPVDVNATCSSTTAVLTVAGSEGVVGGLGLVYQWYENVPGNTGWTAVSNGGVYSGATSATLNISSTSGLNNYQYYCQIREDAATCYTATEAAIIKDGTTIWDGTTWSNGVPNSTMLAIINGNYDTTLNGNIECCSLIVNTGFTLEIQDANYVEIQFDLTVNGTLNVLNNGSLVQVDDSGVNTGNISYQRSTTGVALDYVYWSSPVAGVNTPAGYIYNWSPTFANPNLGQGYWIGAANTGMQAGVGYIMRDVFSRNFIGVPNNGIVTTPIARGSDLNAGTAGPNGIMRTTTDDNWNLLGNPYPSAISINSFLTTNTELDGFVRLWTHGTSPSSAISDPFYDNFVSNYTAGDYIAINGAGATSGPGTLSVIGGGQSFFTLMNAGAAATSSATFNNAMRDKGYSNSQFYRTANTKATSIQNTPERHRIWLDLQTPSNETTRTLVAYVEGATESRDRMFDALTDYKSAQNFYSLIDEDIMAIQGRSLPFNVNDKVRMGIKTSSNGTHTISIATVDGLFESNQNIFLEDTELNVIHDLRQAPYSFYALSGIHNNRFILRYTDNRLSNEDVIVIENSVSVISNTNIQILSTNEAIKEVQIHNVLGQLLYKKEARNNEVIINTLQKNNAALIVRIILENNKEIVKKVIF
jgi:hypothetical protein